MDPREIARRFGELGVQAAATGDGAVALDPEAAHRVMQLLQEHVDMGGPEALPWLRLEDTQPMPAVQYHPAPHHYGFSHDSAHVETREEETRADHG